MNKLGVYAVYIGLGVAGLVVGNRLGVFRPNSRAWHRALFCAVLCIVLVLAILPFEHIIVTPPFVAVLVLLGAIGELLWSYFNTIDRRLGN